MFWACTDLLLEDLFSLEACFGERFHQLNYQLVKRGICAINLLEISLVITRKIVLKFKFGSLTGEDQITQTWSGHINKSPLIITKLYKMALFQQAPLQLVCAKVCYLLSGLNSWEFKNQWTFLVWQYRLRP